MTPEDAIITVRNTRGTFRAIEYCINEIVFWLC